MTSMEYDSLRANREADASMGAFAVFVVALCSAAAALCAFLVFA